MERGGGGGEGGEGGGEWGEGGGWVEAQMYKEPMTLCLWVPRGTSRSAGEKRDTKDPQWSGGNNTEG